MSHRDRPGSAGLAPPPASAARAVSPRHGGSATGNSWDDVFPTLLPGQQAHLLALAAGQGHLSLRQLPVPEHAPADRARAFLTGLLSPGGGEPLAQVSPEPIDIVDRDLDAGQIDALTRALHTPDLCLIQGGPGTGKTRLIAELVRQTARRGWRVLLTSPNPAAVDAVLARLVGETDVIAIRALGRDERLEDLPAASLARTYPSLRKQMLDGGAAQARQLHELAADCQARAQADLAILSEIERLARIALPGAAPASEDATLSLAADQANHDAELARLDEAAAAVTIEMQRLQQRAGELDNQLTAQPQSATERGWLTKLFGSGRPSPHVQEWKKERDDLREAEERAKRRAEDLAARRGEIVERWHAERERREAEADRDRRNRESKCAGVISDLRRLADSLSSDRPLTDPLDATERARVADAAQAALVQGKADDAFATRWSEFLHEHGRELPARLLRCVTLAAAPLSALAFDDVLAELSRDGPYDLVIVDDTHCLGESELLNAARRGQRWVFVGEPGDITLPSTGGTDTRPRDRKEHHNSGRTRPALRGPGRNSPWARLWQQLHADPWRTEHGRTCVWLEPLTATQAGKVETESVADSPDVELYIWTPPQGAPTLAAVAFPPSTTPADAFTYLYRELHELPAPGSAASWNESTDRVVCQFGGLPGDPVELEPGVILRLRHDAGACRIATIEFARTAGWDRARAESWVVQTLRASELGRTAVMTVQHRIGTGPSAFASALGFDVPAPPGVVAGTVAEFVPVPALSEPQARRRGDIGLNGQQRRLPPLRGGAGLDLDVSDPRQRERLPADLQPNISPRGFVNLPEAEAIIRVLETLLDDLPAERPESIAVLPMYEAQAELLRQLAARSSLLASAAVPVRMLAACNARHLEADWVIVGLTRSHGHRAVSYGNGPADLACALTRTRKRLILVGDPGTLCRRAHWEGPLEHLDADAAAREREWVGALVHLLQGHGPPIVHLCEGPP